MMKIEFTKIAFAVALAFGLCFAQDDEPEKLAVYVSGASGAGINKSLGYKLLVTMVQSGMFAEIDDPGSFQDELAKSGKNDITSISQAAKRRGADYVCAVNMVEAFGAYSITARLVKVSGSLVLKTGSTDRALQSLDDLTIVSNELARQLLPAAVAPAPVAAAPPPVAAAPPPAAVYAPPAAAFAPPPAAVYAPPAAAFAPPVADLVPAVVAAVQNQCARTYNINELLFKIKDGFPAKLKDCSSTLAKDMLNPFGKKLEPKSFMTQCPIDGIKSELPAGFPGVDKVLGSLTNFVSGLMNTAMAGGAVDPKKLVSAVASMNVSGLLNEIKSLSNNACIVDEPYEPTVAPVETAEKSSSGEKGKSSSFGIRAGINSSYTSAQYRSSYSGSNTATYGAIAGMQFGIVFDYAMSRVAHLQPNLMYIQKGRRDGGDDKTAHYLEFLLPLSLKFSVFRLHIGPYIGYAVSSEAPIFDDGLDFGTNLGFGFDIGMFYIGVFGEEGITNMSKYPHNYYFRNITYGFNLGINL